MKPQHGPCSAPSCGGDEVPDSRESRCVCGNLLARLTPEGVELKCRRCKRIVLVPWSQRGQRGPARGARWSP